MSRDLDRSLLSGVAWSAVLRVLSQVVTWVLTVQVARILSPGDYGVAAAATAFIGFVRMLTELGLGSAIVSRAGTTDLEMRQLGGLSLQLGLLAWLVIAAAAPLVASVVGIAETRAVLQVLGFVAFTASINTVAVSLLQKALRYKLLAGLDLARAIVTSLSAFALALAGYGYWALVGAETIAAVVYTAAVLRASPYRVAWPRLRELRGVLAFSGSVLVGRIGWYVYTNADAFVVGRRLGKAILGDYSMALLLTALPADKISAMFLTVTPAIFARVQDDAAAVRRYLLFLVEASAFVITPLCVGLALVAPDAVQVLLGEKWLGTVPLIRALALFISVRGVMPLFSQVLIARQRTATAMWFGLSAAVIMPLAFLVGSRWGAVGVAAAWSVLYPVLAVAQARYAYREIGVTDGEMALVVGRPFLACLVMAVAVLLVSGALVESSQLARLVATVFTGMVAYSAVLLGLFRQRLLTGVRAIQDARKG